eukprot:g20035.t1
MTSWTCSSDPAPAAQTTTGSREYEAALVADVIATWNLDPRWRYTIELSKSRVPDVQVLFKGCKRYQRKVGYAVAAAAPSSSSLQRKDSRPVLADLLWADKIAAETKEKASCKTVEVYTVTFSDSERQHKAPVPAKGKVLRVYFYVPSSTCASGTGSASASDGSSAPVVTFSFEEDKIVLPSNRPSSAKHIKTRINLALKETAKLLENVGGGSSSSARFPGQERKAWNLRQVAETKFEKDRTQNLATLLQDGSIYFDGGKPLRKKRDAPGGGKPFAGAAGGVDVKAMGPRTVHPREQEQGFSDDKPAQDHDDHPGRGINVEYLLQNTFDAADEEKTGFLLFTEVHHLLIALFGKRLRSFEVTKLVAKTEEDVQGQVDYAKFLAKLSPEIQRRIEANAREGSRMQHFLKGDGGDEEIENARELIADFLPLLSSEQLLSQNEGELVETAKLLHQTRERGQQFITRALARDWLARSRRFTAIELSLIMTRLPMQAAYNEDVVRHLLELRGAFQKTFAEKFLLDASHKDALAENMKPWLRKVCVAVLEVVGVVGREVPLRSFAKIVGGGGAGVNGGKNSAGIKVGETVTDEDEAELPERDHDEGTALDQRMTDLLAAGKKRILLPIWVLREALLRQEEYLFSRGEIHALLCWVDVAEGGFVELVSFLVAAHVTAFELFLLPQLKAMDERNRLQKQGESGYGPATSTPAATTAASAPDAFGFAAVGNVGSGSKMEGAFSFLRQQHQNDHGPDAGADQQQTNSNSPSNARISKTVSINSPRNRQTTSANQEQDFRKRELLERDILQLNFSRKWIDIPTLLQIARPLEKVLRASMDSDEIVVASVANFATGAIAEDGDADAPRPGDSFQASSSSSRTKETVLAEREARGFVAQAPFYTSAAQHHGGTSLGSGGGSAAPAQHSVQAGGAPGVVAATGGATKLPPQQQHLPADHSHRAEIQQQQQQLITTGSSTSAVLVKEILWADYVKDEISRLWEFRNNVQLQNFVAGADLQTLLSRYDAVFAGVRENLMEDSCKNLQRRLGGSGEGGGGAADKVGVEGCHRDGAADHGLLQPATSAGPGALGSSLVGAMSFSAGMLTSPLASGGGALSGAKSFAGAGLAAVGAQKLPPGALKQQLLQKKVGSRGGGSSPRGAAEKTDRWKDPLRPFRELLFKTDSVKASTEQAQQDDQRPPVDDPDSARFHTLLADFVRRWNEAEREDGGLISTQQGGALTAAGVNENAYARNEREVGARRGSMDTSFARRGSMDLQKRRSIGGARGSILGTAQTPQLHQQL